MTKRMATRQYLTLEQFADRIGVDRGQLSERDDLPPVDAIVGPVNDDGTLPPGTIKVWLVGTIDAWHTGVDHHERVHQVYRRCDATKEFLSAYDLELLTGTPASTWRHWATIGATPPSEKIGRRRVYPRDSAMAWLRDKGMLTTV